MMSPPLDRFGLPDEMQKPWRGDYCCVFFPFLSGTAYYIFSGRRGRDILSVWVPKTMGEFSPYYPIFLGQSPNAPRWPSRPSLRFQG